MIRTYVVHVQVCYKCHIKGMSIDREANAQLSVECNFPAIINNKINLHHFLKNTFHGFSFSFRWENKIH